jgi:spore coat protein CotH
MVINKQYFVYSKSILVFLLTVLLTGCSEESNTPIVNEEDPVMTSFSFLSSKNNSIASDIYLDIEGQNITGYVPLEGDIQNLVASFEHEGSEVMVQSQVQVSGQTYNDFRKTTTYTVKTSEGTTQNYSVNITYFTGLPIIYLDTNGVPIDSKEEYREGNVSIQGNNNYDHVYGTEMKIKGRGNSTWYFHEKKPFQLKFGEETSFLGMPEDKKWIFLAEHSDKSLLRNKIAFELGYMSNLDWTPESHFAEVFVNDEYNGTYNISQKVEESDHRVALGNTGYLMEIDQLERMESDDVYFYTDQFLINIKEPEIDWDGDEYNYAKNLLNEFETALFSENFKDPLEGYQKYIDMDSFIDWYLISEITKNQDSKSWSSIFLNVIPGEKIKMGPLWDFDLAFGNVNYSECEFPEGFWVKENAWYKQLFNDPYFVGLVKERFNYFKQNQTLILEKIDTYANYLSMSQSENDLRWDTIGNPVWPNPIVFPTYEQEVEHLKSWYSQRMNWLDAAINQL